jgi:hypothetical protein
MRVCETKPRLAIGQSGEQGRGLGEQAAAAREQLRLINEQIAALRPISRKTRSASNT